MSWTTDPMTMLLVATGSALVLDLVPPSCVSGLWVLVNLVLASKVYKALRETH